LAAPEPHGFCGGLSESEREAIRTGSASDPAGASRCCRVDSGLGRPSRTAVRFDQQVVSWAAAATAASRVQPAASAAASSSWAQVAQQPTRAGREHHRQRRRALGVSGSAPGEQADGVEGIGLGGQAVGVGVVRSERQQAGADVTDPVRCRRAVGTLAGRRGRAQGEGRAATATALAAGAD